ncbi:MAG: hypothetical protein P9X24_00610 [Candidatus Hatepunaea meridiana]|nr:hypothetical protein [Candidatus Hatepunaea meridiana]
MAFSPFTKEDFELMEQEKKKPIPKPLENKINELRNELDNFTEFKLEYFEKHIVRKKMRSRDDLVFGHPRGSSKHWFLFNVGGDQNQVQLNIGMWSEFIRVGLGFQIGRQVNPKPPAFQVLQTFLCIRPPLPFRDAFYNCVKENGFVTQFQHKYNEDIDLETFIIPPDSKPVFIFIGKLWNISEAITKTPKDYRRVFNKLMPFYEELILAGGRYSSYPHDLQ